jgi:DNA-binding transcriptional ArsR family regulator
MKPICPGCASRDAYEIKPAEYVCPCRVEFTFSEGLIPMARSIEMARVLTHPTRVAILDCYQEKPKWSANQLAKKLGVPLTNVSYHMKQLREHLVGKKRLLVKDGQRARRGAVETFYRVNPEIVGGL